MRFNCTSALKYGIIVSKGSEFINSMRDKTSKLKLTHLNILIIVLHRYDKTVHSKVASTRNVKRVTF